MKQVNLLNSVAKGVASCVILGFLSVGASAQTSVFVPGNALGSFGNPSSGSVPFVSALTVTGPGTITIAYVSGTVADAGGINTGPDGVPWDTGGLQTPLQEAIGVSGGNVNNLDALIGVFVPESRVNFNGFSAIDGTKDATRVGIVPSALFFVGTGKTFSVNQAGTLFLGINDMVGGDNGGGFNVTATGP